MLEVHYLLCALMVTVLAYCAGFGVGILYHYEWCYKRACQMGLQKAFKNITEVEDHGNS